MTKTIIHGLALTLLVIAGYVQTSQAAEVTGLYQATLPIESREDQKQRTRAFSAGLQQVLVKLTGRDEVATLPELQEAVRNPQTYAESWSYQTRIDAHTQMPHLEIDINFYPDAVQRLLNNAGVLIWPATRPETLVWMIIQDEKGERVLSDASTGTGQIEMQALQVQGVRYGLPGTRPLWDLDDQMAMPPDLLWMQDEAALRTASSRYKFESIVAIRIIKLVTGQVVGKSVHFFRDHVHETETLEGSLDDFFKATAGMVAKELSDNYAVRMSSSTKGETSSESQLLLLSVEGIKGLNDYAAVQHYVESLAGISEVHVREAKADTLTFSLNAAGQVRQLVENLAIDRKLQAVGNPAATAGAGHLHYRWQSQ